MIHKIIDPKILLAALSLVLGLSLSSIIYTVRAGDTAARVELDLQEYNKRLTDVEQAVSAIPYIQTDIKELKQSGDAISKKVSNIERAQFKQVVSSEEQLKLLRRALEHLEGSNVKR